MNMEDLMFVYLRFYHNFIIINYFPDCLIVTEGPVVETVVNTGQFYTYSVTGENVLEMKCTVCCVSGFLIIIIYDSINIIAVIAMSYES